MMLTQFSILAMIGITIIVLCTGCITTESPAPATVSIPPESPSLVPVISGTQTGSTTTAKTDSGTVPESPFITIDPISDKNTGDLIIISGTTNLPSGASIYLKEVNESTGELSMRANHIACPDTHGVNRWRFIIDSTPWMRPGTQRFHVSTPKGDVNSSVQFNLTGTFLGPEKILYYKSGSKSATIPGTGSYPYITVDYIDDHKKGDIFRITGTTTLIEGTMLQCTVRPEYYEDRSKRPAIISKDDCDGQFIIAGAPTAVVKGTGDTNRWICPVDLIISPENIGMIVHVSTTNEYYTIKEIFGNATFNLS
ncbi:MAG: hypothetical protein LUQ66_10090 [Methanoregula sp.]|nr:hypothetical protein [Methanoregula sp.]